MSLSFGREGEVKVRAARGIVNSPQAATVRFNYGAADPKSHAGAIRLGGEKRIEDLVQMLWGQPHAGIADGHLKLIVFHSERLDGELPRSAHGLHRIDAVYHEVHHDLLQLHAIPH